MRIISLIPSATEIVCLLGLRDSLVGVTHECHFPAEVGALPHVTRSTIPPNATSAEIDRLVSEQMATEPSLYTLDGERLAALRPDLIITQTLCGVCAVAESEVERIANRLTSPPTILRLQPVTLNDVLDSISEVAHATDATQRGEDVTNSLRERINKVAARHDGGTRPRVALLEWLDPPFAAGHWNPELVDLAGGVDVFGKAGEKSRRVTWSEVADADPDVIVVACCGLDEARIDEDIELLANQEHWQTLRAVQSGRVLRFDGSQFFNRPGPRLVDSLEMLAEGLQQAANAPTR